MTQTESDQQAFGECGSRHLDRGEYVVERRALTVGDQRGDLVAAVRAPEHMLLDRHGHE